MLKRIKPIYLLIVLSTIIIFIFFGKIILNANTYYFIHYGDGIQTYHEYLYHIKYDDTYIFSKSMQYPYGENGYFSVNPLMLSNAVKIIDKIIPIQKYSLGFYNLFVIFSLLISSILMFRIFKYLKISDYYAVLFSLLITFMSPQIVRFGGHNSLGYVFAIPLIIYSMMKTWENPTYLRSIFIGFAVFFLAGNHLYYLGFFAILILAYYALQFILFKKEQVISIRKRIIHLTLELILPIVITEILINSIHPSSDRTEFPWSFFAALGSISGLYYSENSIYTKFLNLFINHDNIIWEAKSYIGLVSVIISLGIFLYIFNNILNKKFKSALYFNKNSNIVILTIIGILGLIVGIGFPFNTDLGHPLFFKIGPIKQFRAIARFTWLYYYTINIVSFYLLYYWLTTSINKYLKYSILLLIIFIYSSEIYLNNKQYNSLYANRVEILEENGNEVYNPLKKVNIDNFQAIIGIPFFHLGSENLYMAEGQGMRNAMIYSLKTGLPTLDVHSNRTPLQETFNTAEIIYEPYRKYTDFERFPNKKSFLVIVDRTKKHSKFEDILINNAVLIDSTNEAIFYELPFSYFESSLEKHTSKLEENIKNNIAIELSKSNAYFNTFESNEVKVENTYFTPNAKAHLCQHPLNIFEDTVPKSNTLKYNISFWTGNIHEDVLLRGYFYIELKDKYGRLYESREMNLGKRVSLIDGDWALIEDSITLNNASDILKITLINREISDKYNLVDNLLIRPANQDVYFRNDYLFYNNRFFLNPKK